MLEGRWSGVKAMPGSISFFEKNILFCDTFYRYFNYFYLVIGFVT